MAPYWVQGFSDEENTYGGQYAVLDMIAGIICVTAIVLLQRQNGNQRDVLPTPDQLPDDELDD